MQLHVTTFTLYKNEKNERSQVRSSLSFSFNQDKFVYLILIPRHQ